MMIVLEFHALWFQLFTFIMWQLFVVHFLNQYPMYTRNKIFIEYYLINETCTEHSFPGTVAGVTSMHIPKAEVTITCWV